VKKAHIDLKEEIQDGMFLHIPPTWKYIRQLMFWGPSAVRITENGNLSNRQTFSWNTPNDQGSISHQIDLYYYSSQPWRLKLFFSTPRTS
jgi:hypothetical protein